MLRFYNARGRFKDQLGRYDLFGSSSGLSSMEFFFADLHPSSGDFESAAFMSNSRYNHSFLRPHLPVIFNLIDSYE